MASRLLWIWFRRNGNIDSRDILDKQPCHIVRFITRADFVRGREFASEY